MVAQFPDQIRYFDPKVDLSTTVMADHINALQEEVSAVEQVLDKKILSPSWTGSFSTSSTWTTLHARIQNIEAGLVNGVTPSPYVKVIGGSTISPTAVVGLVMQPTTGTSNLFEARSSSSTLGFNIDYNGIPRVGASNVLYVNSGDYNYLLSLIQDAQNTANAAKVTGNVHPFLLAGM